MENRTLMGAETMIRMKIPSTLTSFARRGRHALPILFGGAAFLGLALYLVPCVTGAKALNADDYGRAKIPAVNGVLQRMEPGFVLLAGDSHMELYGTPALACGKAVANVGVSGVGVRFYSGFVDQIAVPAKPSVAVLTIGTNDLLRKKRPTSDATRTRWEEDARKVVVALRGMAPKVVVNAVPPIGESLDKVIDSDGVKVYSDVLSGICSAVQGCVYKDPFAKVRSFKFGIARPGTMSDELHLANYRRAYSSLDDELCR